VKADLQNSLLYFFDAAVEVAPGWFLSKTKTHLLTHIIEDIVRFSVANNFAEEVYESNNTPVRNTLLFSNRMAASRDSARAFERMERVRHLISGGWYYSTLHADWVQAGPGCLEFIKSSVAFQKLYGIRAPHQDDPVPGNSYQLLDGVLDC
jgi:hypothetical protein